jgi:cyclopropane fatty-acyl-phospholipid synthase-like methyltransferase
MGKIIDEVSAYYNQKIKEFGATPKGVDWNGDESQQLRFLQLCSIINSTKDFAFLDYGCGYGAMYDYMKGKYPDMKYIGYDIADEMIEMGKQKYPTNEKVSFINQLNLLSSKADYCVASGIFNVKLENTENDWKEYILKTLSTMNDSCTKGFAFNVLTSYSDKEFMKDYLFYANPNWLFDYCKLNFSKNVALLHDYQLYEFTILVRK